uniref:LITAF domain-containing protein n=2 Tax=Scophthalmus maximus TaxID=52904 RepID=A0A8D2ZV65_SCOMX
TQCPECRQYIMTETFSSISSVTWLLCFITAGIGCMAGCCLLPFCIDQFKSITHRCPKCRTLITTIKRL